MQEYNKKIVLVFLSLIFIVWGGVVLLKGDLFYSDKLSFGSYEEFNTDSGLKILFLQDDSLPFVQYRILFPKAGADYDFEGKSGLSTLTAYLSEQGAGGLSATQLQEELNQLGAELEIGVDRQTVNMALSGLSWHGEKLWDLFGKIIAEPHFKDEEMEILRKQFSEKRLKMLDTPDVVAYTVWRKRIFEGPVGADAVGTLTSLSKITLEDIKSFYKRRYLEGNPILMVTGQYDKRLKTKIISFFNERFSYQDQELKNVSIPDLEPDLEPDFRLLINDNLNQAQIFLGYPISSFPVDNPREFLALRIASYVLGGGGSMTARLFVDLREKRGLTYGVYSGVDFGKLYGVFWLEGSTKTSSVREFLEETLLILRNFQEKGISSEEMQRAKQNLKSGYLKKMETPENRLNQLVYYEYYLGVDSSFLKNYLDILDDISLEEVNQLIKKFVLSKALQVLVYGHPSLQSQLEDIKGLAPLKTVSFKDYFKTELSFQTNK